VIAGFIRVWKIAIANDNRTATVPLFGLIRNEDEIEDGIWVSIYSLVGHSPII
jgi:hypothetical protein